MEFNLGTLVTAVIASFLSGMGVSALGMLVSFSGKLATFATKLDNMQATLSSHTGAPTIVCNYHDRISDEVQELKTRVSVVEEANKK